MVLSLSLIDFNHPLAHGSSAPRAETWSDAVSSRPRASARPHMTRHHHPLRGLLPDLSATAHETGRILGSPTAYLSFQSNLERSSPGFSPFIDAGRVARV
jgi:hypothetical protein